MQQLIAHLSENTFTIAIQKPAMHCLIFGRPAKEHDPCVLVWRWQSLLSSATSPESLPTHLHQTLKVFVHALKINTYSTIDTRFIAPKGTDPIYRVRPAIHCHVDQFF